MPHGYSGKILHVDLSSVSLRQEAPAHMPQLKKGLGLIYATNPFGADHMSCEHDAAYEKAFKYYQQRLEFLGLSKPQAPLKKLLLLAKPNILPA